jgi:transcriptional regulator with XRE-family HTH domain
VKLLCHLRQIRGERTLNSIAEHSHVPESALSKIERGIEVPRDEWLQPLADAYGAPVVDWYPPQVLLALTGDDA